MIRAAIFGDILDHRLPGNVQIVYWLEVLELADLALAYALVDEKSQKL